MCAGGQDIPVTLRVAGGVEGGKWKSENDVRATPPIEEEVETTETTEVTEPVEPSAPLYQPVIDRINKLSEKLPDKVAGETVEEMQPMMHHGWGMNDRNHHHTMRMLDRIMRNTSRRPRPPRPGRNGKWGGVAVDPRIQVMPKPYPGLAEIGDPIRQPSRGLLGTNPQVAGLAGLFGGPRQPRYNERTGGDPNISGPMQFPQQQIATPMQPEVMEEQQMEILGQTKQFAGGGIVNALMATPIGQAAIRQYATGGEIGEDVEAEQVLEHTPTGATIEDILAGRATFFGPAKYRHAEVISDISDTLGVAPIRRKKREPIIEDQDGEGGTPPAHDTWSGTNWQGDYVTLQDLPPGKNVHDPTFQLDRLNIHPALISPTGFLASKGINALERALGYTHPELTIPDPSKPFDSRQWGLQDVKDPEYLQLDKRAEDRRKAPEVYAPGWDAKKASEDLRTNPYGGPTQPEIDHGAGKGGITTPGAVNLDDTRLGTPDPGQGGTFTPGQAAQTPAQAIQKSTAELINYGTKPGASGSIGTPQSITGIDDKSLADAQNPLSFGQHQLAAQGINLPGSSVLGLGKSTPAKAQSLWSQQFDPRSGYKGTINDPEREDRKIGSTGGIPAQPGLQDIINVDPNEFDPSLFSGGLGSLIGPGSIRGQQAQIDLARSIADSITPPPTRTYKQLMDAQALRDSNFQDYGTLTGSDFTAAIEDFQQSVADAGIGGPGDDDSPGQEEAGEDALGGIT